jgi:FMN phosphatase YigB (HAD superfamily)
MATAVELFPDRRALLFDLDGTLYGVDEYPEYIAELDRVTGLKVRELFGMPSGEAAYARLEEERVRLGVATRGEALQELFGFGLAEMNRHREALTEPRRFLRPDPRLVATLERLAADFTLLLGTNNTPVLAREVLAVLGVPAELFTVIVSGECAGAAKPHRRFFDEIASRSGFSFAEMASLGDRDAVDLAPARALGMAARLVSTMADVYALAPKRENAS